MITTHKRYIAVDGGAEKEYLEITCLSTDTKPTDGMITGSELVEIDTGKRFLFDEVGEDWYEQPASGGGGVEVEALSVTQNITYTAPEGKAYSPVTVNVPNSYTAGDEGKVVSSGALVSQSSDTVTENGTVDTTLINSLTVNVPSGDISVPSDYLLLDNLLVSNAAIDIGIKGDNNTRIWGRFHRSSYNAGNLYGANDSFFFNADPYSPKIYYQGYSKRAEFSSMTLLNHDSTVYVDNISATIDGVTVAYPQPITEFETTSNILLFGRPGADGFVGWFMRFIIEKSGVKVRDYVPVQRKADSVVGIYDLVNGTFQTGGTMSVGAPALSNYV